ncbi:MAG: hypothetical protein KGM47_12475 [Acidobacteriota bacterium]|nr:hypothetical protein [Acidobacteriota bacterium]
MPEPVFSEDPQIKVVMTIGTEGGDTEARLSAGQEAAHWPFLWILETKGAKDFEHI